MLPLILKIFEFDDRAKAHVLAYPDLSRALRFCLQRNDHLTASTLVLNRTNELNDDLYELMNSASDEQREKHPLASNVNFRAMIDFTLMHGRSSRYIYAAEHLHECAVLNVRVVDYGIFPNHTDYILALKLEHHQKTSFWNKVN